MSVSSKCYYALRAVYALAEHNSGTEPLKISAIAEREQIPIRFLEVILNQLKGGGFVRSKRGAEGGYFLARPAEELTIGAVMRFVDGPIAPVDCVSQSRHKECEFHGECHFFGFWGRVRQAMSDVVDKTTFADLVRESRDRPKAYIGDWTI
jgi:Rrf2 family cysteine metabolism transcriptional repressor